MPGYQDQRTSTTNKGSNIEVHYSPLVCVYFKEQKPSPKKNSNKISNMLIDSRHEFDTHRSRPFMECLLMANLRILRKHLAMIPIV